MDSKRKMTPVQQAAERARAGMELLRERGFERLEVTQDRAGIEWSRWVLAFPEGGMIHVILWATPFGYDIFEAMTYQNSVPALVEALDNAIKTH